MKQHPELRKRILEDVLGNSYEAYINFKREPLMPKKRQHRQRIPLWRFLLHLLDRDEGQVLVQWTCEDNLEFKIKDPISVASLWGSIKDKVDMTYEKLGRAMRYYYGKNIIEKVSGRRYSYKFIESRKTTKYLPNGMRRSSTDSMESDTSSEDIQSNKLEIRRSSFDSMESDASPNDIQSKGLKIKIKEEPLDPEEISEPVSPASYLNDCYDSPCSSHSNDSSSSSTNEFNLDDQFTFSQNELSLYFDEQKVKTLNSLWLDAETEIQMDSDTDSNSPNYIEDPFLGRNDGHLFDPSVSIKTEKIDETDLLVGLSTFDDFLAKMKTESFTDMWE